MNRVWFVCYSGMAITLTWFGLLTLDQFSVLFIHVPCYGMLRSGMISKTSSTLQRPLDYGLFRRICNWSSYWSVIFWLVQKKMLFIVINDFEFIHSKESSAWDSRPWTRFVLFALSFVVSSSSWVCLFSTLLSFHILL